MNAILNEAITIVLVAVAIAGTASGLFSRAGTEATSIPSQLTTTMVVTSII